MTRTPSLRRLIVPFVVGALALSTIVPTATATDPNPNKKPKDPVSVHDLNATILRCLGIDHLKLTYKYQGRYFRLTDVHGELVKGVAAPRPRFFCSPVFSRAIMAA